MSEHAEHLDLLNRNISMEKERQMNSLSEKIAERQKMKAAILARRHEAEMAKELAKQREERNQVEDDHVRGLLLLHIETTEELLTIYECFPRKTSDVRVKSLGNNENKRFILPSANNSLNPSISFLAVFSCFC